MPTPAPRPAIPSGLQFDAKGQFAHFGPYTFKRVTDGPGYSYAVMDRMDALRLDALGALCPRWHLASNGSRSRYVRVKVDGTKRQVARLIMRDPARSKVGYRTNDRTDLRRANLRLGHTFRTDTPDGGERWTFTPDDRDA